MTAHRALTAVLLLGLIGCELPDQSKPADAGALREWNANEVSVLFPVPTDASLLLGVRGLLDESLFGRLGDGVSGLPRLVEAAGTRDVFPDLRVVSARVDPCFDGTRAGTGTCRRQMRLVAQVFEPETKTFSDASIHLFYELNEDQLLEVLSRLRALSRVSAPTGKLGVHPVLEREQLVGPYSDETRAIITSVCSSTSLTRFTFMATGRSKNWLFFVFDRQPGGTFTQSNVVGVGDSDAFTDQGGVGFRNGITAQVPWFPASLLTSAGTLALEPAAFAAAYEQLARLSNPRLTKTEEVNCAACHAAGSTQLEALGDRDARRPPVTASEYAPGAFPTLRLGNLHAFSYFVDTPSVSERTANETEEVLLRLQSAEFLNRLTPAQRARLE